MACDCGSDSRPETNVGCRRTSWGLADESRSVMQSESIPDVPSPIDLRRMSDARAWADAAMVRRPWREMVFARIIQEIVGCGARAPSVLELGSGPGFLAQRILEATPVASYWATDFSRAMHALARERLGAAAKRMRFCELDFKTRTWCTGLPKVDVVVSVQAVHELRHKRHAPRLFKQVRGLLAPTGIFLVCDHVLGDDGMRNGSLYMTIEEHENALTEGGFGSVRLLLQERSLALCRASDTAL